MEELAIPFQHARELVVEGLRIELAGDAEAGRVMEDCVEGGVGELADVLGDVAVSEGQRAARLR